MSTPSINLTTVFREGRLIRGDYARIGADGRKMLCLLTAMAGDARVRPESCPASIAPPWMAWLLPWIDDAGTKQAWPGHIERLIPLADRLHTLGPRAEWRCKRVAVLEAMKHTKNEQSLAACRTVVGLLDRAIAGDRVSPDEWKSAEARAAAREEEAAAWAAVEAAREDAAAWWVVAAWAAEGAAAEGAKAADRMIADMITVFEEELAGSGA